MEQESYLSDAMDAGPEVTEEVAPESVEETPPEAETEEVVEEKQPETGKEEEKDPLDSVFSDENGEFDADSFLNFSLPEEEGEQEPEETEPVPEAEEGDVPEWKREFEEERKFSESLKEEALGPLIKVAELIDQGKDATAALSEVYAELQKRVDDKISENSYERRIAREERHRKESTGAALHTELTERARTNVSGLVAALPGKTNEEKSKLFSHLMFSKDIGAPILNREFKKAHPDYEKKPPSEQKKLADRFLTKVQADKSELRYIWDRCLDRATRLKQKTVSQRQRMIGQQKETERRNVAQKHPAGPVKRQSQSGEQSPWDAYFDRV